MKSLSLSLSLPRILHDSNVSSFRLFPPLRFILGVVLGILTLISFNTTSCQLVFDLDLRTEADSAKLII